MYYNRLLRSEFKICITVDMCKSICITYYNLIKHFKNIVKLLVYFLMKTGCNLKCRQNSQNLQQALS